MKALENRRFTIENPVSYLVAAIIEVAMEDACYNAEEEPRWRKSKHRKRLKDAKQSALEFLQGEDYLAFCAFLSIRPSVAKAVGGLAGRN